MEARVVNLKLGAALLVLDFPSAPLVYVSKTTRLLQYMNCNETKPSTNSNELVLFTLHLLDYMNCNETKPSTNSNETVKSMTNL